MKNPLKFLRKDTLIFAGIVVAALLTGLLVNHFRKPPLSLNYASKEERLNVAVAAISPRPAVIPVPVLPDQLTLGQFSDFVENRGGLVLDARYRINHQLAHVPGAISFPRDDFAEAYAALKGRLESDRSQPIAVYCDGKDCEDSQLVQKALRDLGYTQVAVFKGGWSEWTRAGKPKEASR